MKVGAYFDKLLIERQCVGCGMTKYHYGLCGKAICDKCNNGMYVMSYHKVDADGLILIVEERT